MTFAVPVQALQNALPLEIFSTPSFRGSREIYSDAAELLPWQAKRSLAHIAAHLDRTIRIGELAELAKISHSYFTRAFKATFGCAPQVFILDRRIAQAKELMLNTDEPLCEVALACGFSDQSHMSRIFRRLTGDSPNAWRCAQRQGTTGQPAKWRYDA
jgi:AraC-like DNA-binding protein